MQFPSTVNSPPKNRSPNFYRVNGGATMPKEGRRLAAVRFRLWRLGLRALRAGLPGTFAAHLTVARLATRAFGHCAQGCRICSTLTFLPLRV